MPSAPKAGDIKTRPGFASPREPPKFEITDFFRVIFYRNPEYSLKAKAEKRLVDGLAERLAENQRKILLLMRETPQISKNELSRKLKISTTAVDKNIAQLKKKGFLERVGPDKGGHWEVLG